jgi:hypothetical protein
MGRLFYESRFRSIPAIKNVTPKNGFDEKLEKVAKMVPSEIIAAYLTMVGFIPSIQGAGTQNIAIWVVFGFCLALTPFYLNRVAEPGKPKFIHILLSTIAFCVWAYVTSGKQLMAFNPSLFQPALASIILIAFSVASTLIDLSK